jgi:hypothetical protein
MKAPSEKLKTPSVKTPSEKAPAMRKMEIEIHRGPKMKVTGFTVHHHMLPKATKSSAFMENTTHSQPFGANQHEAMMDHIDAHTSAQLGHVGGAAEPEGEEQA